MYRDVGSLGNEHTAIEANAQSHFAALEPQTWPEQWQPSEDFPTPQSVGPDRFSQTVNDALLFSTEQATYRLGESYLPVAPFREYFLDTVANSQNTVVSSETGSGKSSQLGLYLLEAGYPRVYVSSPRILAARELKERAQQNLGPEYEHLAGYLTGNADDSDCHPDARLIYVTEQLLFKMANRNMLGPNDVIINDEAHERTTGTVLLLGLIKELQRSQPELKLIVSSASIDTDKFSRYLTDDRGEPAPVMILPGRTHPVTWSETEEPVAGVAKKHMKLGHNVLVFEPGMARMKETWAKMSSRMRDRHTVHMLHGDLSPREQKAALNPDDGNHIVANKIGETSITPQGKDVVVDSGLSNVGRYEQGVQVLQTIFSSQDEIIQRAGRVGRTKPGQHILATPNDTPPPPSFRDREGYGLPPIQTSSVATYVAELLASGRRLEDLPLMDHPTAENLQHDYRILTRIGALAIEGTEKTLTPIGRQLIDLPLDVSWARMVVEARSIG
ncbi:MAG TPA: helicase-related protein, partial [Candidatus Saccharimonadales bacterium]